jgi:hypothetical protein
MTTIDTTIRLGITVRDLISGFTGIAASKVELMNGNVQFAVQPKLTSEAKPGEFPDAMNIDFHTLELVDAGLADRVTAPGPTTIQLGDKVRDTVTLQEGIAVNRITFMNGCIYYNVQGAAEKDKQTGLMVAPERLFVMQSCLESVKPAVVVTPAPKPSTGGRVPGGPATRAQRAA